MLNYAFVLGINIILFLSFILGLGFYLLLLELFS